MRWPKAICSPKAVSSLKIAVCETSKAKPLVRWPSRAVTDRRCHPASLFMERHLPRCRGKHDYPSTWVSVAVVIGFERPIDRNAQIACLDLGECG